MFKITGGKGFQVTFANGYKVSVQFGPGRYCEHYGSFGGLIDRQRDSGNQTSKDAEIAVLGPSGFVRMDGEDDDVIGYQSPEQMLAIMVKVSQFKPCG